jgi:hypothetical protein
MAVHRRSAAIARVRRPCPPARAAASSLRCNRYADLECIGTGHHSRVFRARHVPSGALVALKKVVVFEIPNRHERNKCLQVPECMYVRGCNVAGTVFFLF